MSFGNVAYGNAPYGGPAHVWVYGQRSHTPLDAFGMDAPWEDWAIQPRSRHIVELPDLYVPRRYVGQSLVPEDEWFVLYRRSLSPSLLLQLYVPRRRAPFFDWEADAWPLQHARWLDAPIPATPVTPPPDFGGIGPQGTIRGQAVAPIGGQAVVQASGQPATVLPGAAQPPATGQPVPPIMGQPQ